MAYIEFNHISKEYITGETKIKALDDASFFVEKGELAVVLGSSGAGKTTALNILGGMDTATSGQLIVDGNDITKYNKQQLVGYRRTDIGFVFQNQLHDDFGKRQHGKRFQTGIFCEDDPVASVVIESVDASGKIISEENTLNFYTETVGKFTGFGNQLETDSGDFALFLFNKNPNVSNISHFAYPRV